MSCCDGRSITGLCHHVQPQQPQCRCLLEEDSDSFHNITVVIFTYHYILHFMCSTACTLCSPIFIYSFNISSKGILTLSALSSKARGQMTGELNKTCAAWSQKVDTRAEKKAKSRLYKANDSQEDPPLTAALSSPMSPRRNAILFYQSALRIHFSFWLIYLLISENRNQLSAVSLLPAAPLRCGFIYHNRLPC